MGSLGLDRRNDTSALAATMELMPDESLKVQLSIGGLCVVAAVLLVSTRARFVVVIGRRACLSFAQNPVGRVFVSV